MGGRGWPRGDSVKVRVKLLVFVLWKPGQALVVWICWVDDDVMIMLMLGSEPGGYACA